MAHSARFQLWLEKNRALKLSPWLDFGTVCEFEIITDQSEKNCLGTERMMRGVREKTFTHSCTYRRRHVAACCKPCEWHRLLWDKAEPPLLLGSGYEACFGVGWRVCLPGGHLIFFQHAWTTWNTTLSPLSFHDSHACSTLFLLKALLLSAFSSQRNKSLDSFHHFCAGTMLRGENKIK